MRPRRINADSCKLPSLASHSTRLGPCACAAARHHFPQQPHLASPALPSRPGLAVQASRQLSSAPTKHPTHLVAPVHLAGRVHAQVHRRSSPKSPQRPGFPSAARLTLTLAAVAATAGNASTGRLRRPAGLFPRAAGWDRGRPAGRGQRRRLREWVFPRGGGWDRGRPAGRGPWRRPWWARIPSAELLHPRLCWQPRCCSAAQVRGAPGHPRRRRGRWCANGSPTEVDMNWRLSDVAACRRVACSIQVGVPAGHVTDRPCWISAIMSKALLHGRAGFRPA
jgi:hypothetical protein